MKMILYIATKIIVLLFKIISSIFKLIFNTFFKSESNSKELRVLNLEKIRRKKGYRNEWLYHKCKEENLLVQYNRIIKSEINNLKKDYTEDYRTKMSFGKYKGIPIDEVWKNDRNYLVHAHIEGWLDNKPESEYLENIFFEENISYTDVL